jgi:hypothetical protein
MKRILMGLQGLAILCLLPVFFLFAWLHYAPIYGLVLPFDLRPIFSFLDRLWRIVCGGAVAIPLLVLFIWLAKKRAVRQRERAIAKAVATGPTIALLPRSDWKKVKPEDVQLWARLADALPHDEQISFEIGGNDVNSFFALHGSEAGLRAAYTQVKAEWPGAERRPLGTGEAGVPPDPAHLPEGWHLWWSECAPVTWNKPIEALTDDPLRSVLVELNGVTGKGQGLVQIIARRDFGTRQRLGQAAFAARDEETKSKGVRALRSQEAKELEKRARQTFLTVTVRAVGMADTQERAQGIARGLGRTIAASFSYSNPIRVMKEGKDAARVAARALGKVSGSWSADELAWLGHLVGGDMLNVAPRLQSASAKSLPADPEMRIGAGHQTARIIWEQ